MMWFGDDYVAPHRLERVLPTGDMALIINFWENRTRVYNADDPRKFNTFEGSIVVGAYSAFTVIDTDEQRATAGVAFRPGGAFPFLRLPAGELQDSNASLSDLWGRQAASDLREQLLAARSPQAKFKILEQTFLRRLNAPVEPTHPAVSFAVETFRHRPTRPISTVTEQIGLSDRHFIQLFSQHVGLTPKLFCRVQRFQKVLNNLSALAAELRDRLAADRANVRLLRSSSFHSRFPRVFRHQSHDLRRQQNSIPESRRALTSPEMRKRNHAAKRKGAPETPDAPSSQRNRSRN